MSAERLMRSGERAALKKVRKVLRKHRWDETNNWCAGEGYRFPSPRFKSHEHHVAEEVLAAVREALVAVDQAGPRCRRCGKAITTRGHVAGWWYHVGGLVTCEGSKTLFAEPEGQDIGSEDRK